MAIFEEAVEYVLKEEGGLVDNPKDPGGITNFGISLRFLKGLGNKYDFNKNGITEDSIKNLTLSQAQQIYKNEFWDTHRYYEITNQRIANYIFDMAVNMSDASAHKVAQRSLWAFNGVNYPVDDGVMGSATIMEINKLKVDLLPVLRAERAGYYRKIVAANNNLKCFLNGWLNRTYR